MGALAEVYERGIPQIIYMSQVHLASEVKGGFPMHILKIRKVTDESMYRIANIIDGNQPTTAHPLATSSREVETTNIPPWFRKDFALQKRGMSLTALVILAPVNADGGVIVTLGTGTSFDVCFDAFDVTRLEPLGATSLQAFGERFRSSGGRPPGTWAELTEHRVCVKVDHQVHNGAKDYLVDIQVKRGYGRFSADAECCISPG